MGTKRPAGSDEEKQRLILDGLRAWRREHPEATLYEMERETMRRMAELQAHILEELSQDLPAEEKESLEKAAQCPECGTKMQRRGAAARQLQGAGGAKPALETGILGLCPACGAGLFPPG